MLGCWILQIWMMHLNWQKFRSNMCGAQGGNGRMHPLMLAIKDQCWTCINLVKLDLYWVPPKAQPISKMPYQRVTEAQMQERRENYLCYFCQEKWYRGHKCLKPKLYIFLEGMKLLGNDTNEKKLKIEQVTDYAEIASISI